MTNVNGFAWCAAALVVTAFGVWKSDGATAQAATAKPRAGCGSLSPVPADAYPDCRYPAERRFGMFDHINHTTYTWDARDDDYRKRYFNLPFQHFIWDFILTNDKGEWFYWMNAMRLDCPGFPVGNWPDSCNPAPNNLRAFPWGPAALTQKNGKTVPDPRYRSWEGGAVQTMLPGGQIKYTLASQAGPEELTVGPTSLEYNAPGVRTHITGKRIGRGITWDYLYRKPDGDTGHIFYGLDGFTIEGTYFGEHVKGHSFQEKEWGMGPYFNDWWVKNRLGNLGLFFIDYADGNSEFSWFACGEYGFRGMVVTDNKGVVVNTPFINTTQKPGGVFDFSLGNGQVWEYTSVPGTMYGTARRIGDHRKIIKSTAVIQDMTGRLCSVDNSGQQDSGGRGR